MMCRLCGSTNKNDLIIENGYKLQKCLDCDFISIDNDFQAVELKKTYVDYYSQKSDDEIFNDFYVRNSIYSHVIKKISSIMPKKGKLLDVGAAFGNFLDLARKNGWDVYGLEISSRAVDFLNNKMLIPAQNVDILDYNPENKFSAITLIDTLEHVNRPLEYLKKANILLEQDGIIFIRVPNIKFHLLKTRLIKLFKRNYLGLELPHHISHFSPQSLEKCLQMSGFYNIKISPSPQEYNKMIGTKKIYQKIIMHIWKLFGSSRFANLIEATASKK